MNIPEFSIKKPITVLMGTMIIALFGIVSLTSLPVELYPNTSFGEISIIIQVRGGVPPTEVETMVTKPIEEAVSTVSNLKQLLSISKEGESTVVLSFKPGTDMEFAALEVREKFAKIKNRLPKEIEKPVIAQFQQGDVPVFIIAVTSEIRSTEDIRKMVDQTMKENFKRVAGVANVEVAGGRERKILIEVDQVRLAAFGIPMDEVTGALGSNNLNLLSGEVRRPLDRYLVRVIGEFESIEQIKNMALRRTPEGSIIRIKDVAAVKDSYLEPQEYSRLNVRPVVTIYIQKESTKNTIAVAKQLLKEVENQKKLIPKDIHLVITSNQAESIEKNIDNLNEALLKGVVLIILVFFPFLFKLSRELLIVVGVAVVATLFIKGIFLFILSAALVTSLIVKKKFRSILIVTIPIPVSVIATFIFMRSHGLTINVMTLFGLALGVGMLVDNSIVVYENILRKKESGIGMVRSAISGSGEMLLTIVASTATIVIVFLPLVFMGQELQRLYSGMAWTIVVSLLVSMVCAVTLVPMMCARKEFAAHTADSEGGREETWVRRFSKFERRFLFGTIRNRGRVLLFCFLGIMVSWFFISRLGLEYLGSTEQNKFTIFVELPTGARLEASDKVVKKVEMLARGLPEVKNVTSRIEPWSSKVYVELVPTGFRRRSGTEIIEKLRQETNKMHPAFIYFQEEEKVGTKEVILEVFGYDYDKLRELAIAMANRMETVKGLSDTKIRMREGRPEMQLQVNKKRAGLYDMTVSDTANQVHGQMRGFRATVYHTEGREVETISRLDEKYRKTFKDLHNLILANQQGEPVILDQLTEFKFGLGPSEIWRKDRNRMVQVSSNIGKVPLSKVVGEIEKRMKDIPFPEDYFYRVAGDYPTLVSTNKQMRLMIIFVLVLVYLVLASLFESFSQPLLIMIAVPMALAGAVAALYCGLITLLALTVLYFVLVRVMHSFKIPLLVVGGVLMIALAPFVIGIDNPLSDFVLRGPKSISVGALLGMMMLGGIVVNHSIMLVDRINHYVNTMKYSATKAAVLANADRLRPILMTMSTTVLGLIPMAIDRTEGANLWAPLALTVIGGVISSTILTLMVTPAFYILFKDAVELFKSPTMLRSIGAKLRIKRPVFNRHKL